MGGLLAVCLAAWGSVFPARAARRPWRWSLPPVRATGSHDPRPTWCQPRHERRLTLNRALTGFAIALKAARDSVHPP